MSSKLWNSIFIILIIWTLTIRRVYSESYRTEDGSQVEKEPRKSENSIDYRLPITIKPIAYNILIKLQYDNLTNFQGEVAIKTVVEVPTNEIVFHVGSINITSLQILNSPELMIVNTTYDSITEKYKILLDSTLPLEKSVTLKIEYFGNLRNDMRGFYRSAYTDERGNIRWLASTQFQTSSARHAFPCFDEPLFKATFKLAIVTPEKYGCLSNMPIQSFIQGRIDENIQNVYTFENSVSMSTYLVAFVVSDFAEVRNSEGNFTVWSRPNAIDQAKYALKIGPVTLKLFEEAFKSRYQLEKMDMIAVPDFAAGAMENWGLITYRESRLLHSEADSSDLAQQRVAAVIVHECTHMWFGNLVTPKWWSFLWLSEGFARYFEYMMTNELEPSWDMDQQFITSEVMSAFEADALETAKPMTRNVSNRNEIETSGDTIAYAKAASVIRMMHFIFGPNIFNNALQNYLEIRKYSFVTPDDLWSAFQTQVDADDLNLEAPVKTIMNSWAEQAGYPVVSVNISGDTAYLRQERFFLRSTNPSSKKLWWIPITWARNKNFFFHLPSPQYWLKTESAEISLSLNQSKSSNPNAFISTPETWTIFNVKHSGYYRVNYDKDSWNRIIEVLDSENFLKIHEINRAAIVDDLLNLARANLLDYRIALKGISYLKRENHYLPFRAAFSGFEYLLTRFAGQPNHSLLEYYLLTLLEPIRGELTYSDSIGDDRLTRLLRQKINYWTCKMDHGYCIEKSLIAFKKWQLFNQPISPNARDSVYCTVIKYGNIEDWNFLWQKYSETNSAFEKVVILEGLGCSRNVTLLERLLLLSLKDFTESGIRRQDTTTVFKTVYSSELVGAEYVLDFVRKHHSIMAKYDNGYGLVKTVLTGAAKYLSTERLISKYELLIKELAEEFKTISESLNESLELAKYELEWYKKNEGVITDWIYGSEDTSDTDDYRLPINVLPKKYIIRVKPKIEISKFDGTVEIQGVVVKPTKTIVLHASDLHIIDIIIDEIPLKNTAWYFKKKYDFLVINLSDNLLAGHDLKIQIKYVGRLSNDTHGFFKTSYIDDSGNTRWLVATHMEPVFARRMFPCFDEPALKAKFVLSVSRRLKYEAISNTPLNYSVPDGSDRVWDTFEETPVMSTYLVALVVSDFDRISETKRYLYQIWSRPSTIKEEEYAFSLMFPLIKFFERKLGHPYQLSKLDMVGVPEFFSEASAMENWGLLMYTEQYLLYNSLKLPLKYKEFVATTIAHEIAHQWFGNQITPEWWKYIWLSEGLARFFEYHSMNNVEPNWDYNSKFVVEQLHVALKFDSENPQTAMTQDVYSPEEILDRFNYIIFRKSGSIFRMIFNSFGHIVFYKAMNDWLEARKFNTTTPDDLSEALQKEVDLKNVKLPTTMKNIIDSWSMQPGYPLVNVIVTEQEVTVTQEKFYFMKEYKKTNKQLWWIPITWASKSRPDFNKTSPKFWFDDREKKIKLNVSDEWIIFNVQQTGFYRVNYDYATWERIIDLLKSKDREVIHEINRAATIDDLFNLAHAGNVDYALALSAAQYLMHETRYAPWQAALTNLELLKITTDGTELYSHFQLYMKKILTPIFNRLGMVEKNDETMNEKLLRSLVMSWACEMEVIGCVSWARYYFKIWKEESQPVPVHMKEAVYCSAIKHGTIDDWNFLLYQISTTNSEIENIIILNGLGCSKDTSILKRLLMMAINNKSIISQKLSHYAFRAVYTSGALGLNVAIKFINENVDLIYMHFGNLKSMISISKEMVYYASNMDSIKKLIGMGSSRTLCDKTEWYNRCIDSIREYLDDFNAIEGSRLSTTVLPKHYEIYLSPNLDKNEFTFDGSATIKAMVEQQTAVIVVHAKNLLLTNVNVFVNEIDPLGIKSYILIPETDKLVIYLDKKITAGSNLKIQFNYTGTVNEEPIGLYHSSYVDQAGRTRWLVSTRLEPVHARRVFPCFDEPSFKATFTVHIRKPDSYKIISNVPLVSSELETTSNYTWETYKQMLNISTYSMAFTILDFISVWNVDKNVSFSARPSAICHETYALEVVSNLLKSLENFSGGIDTPKKIDIVAIPNLKDDSIENWNLITVKEELLLEPVKGLSAGQKKYIYSTIAHNVAHVWFGNLVTSEWWNFVWMHEGFAKYFSLIIGDRVASKYNLLEQFVSDITHKAMRIDALSITRHMNHDTLGTGINTQHSEFIVSLKSAAVIRMWHHSFGKELFEAGLKTYLEKGQGKTTKPNDLAAGFESHETLSSVENKGRTFKEIMETWTNNPGFPVVTVSWKKGILTITQDRFFSNNNKSMSSNYLYSIPISYGKRSTADFTDTSPAFWLHTRSTNLFMELRKKDWIIVNIQETGYYRVNYSPDLWERIINGLKSPNFDGIHEINRAQIIDDVFNLAAGGYVDYYLAFTASMYLVNETSYLPWRAFFDAYKNIDQDFVNKMGKEVMRTYVLGIIENIYNRLGFDDKEGESMIDQLNRNLILSWACRIGHTRCVETSRKLFKKWRDDETKVIPTNARSVVYCSAIEHGDYSNWEFLWNKYKTSQVSTEKWEILESLSCSKNKTTLHQFLSFVLSNKAVRHDELSIVLRSLLYIDNSIINDMLDFITSHYEEIKEQSDNWNNIEEVLMNFVKENGKKFEKLSNIIDNDVGGFVSSRASTKTSTENFEPIKDRPNFRITPENMKRLVTVIFKEVQ